MRCCSVITEFARMIICGAIRLQIILNYQQGLSVQPFLVKNSALIARVYCFKLGINSPEAHEAFKLLG